MSERVLAAFMPLVDCAVLVAARECGFAAAHGIELELRREPSWAALRDHLATGTVDCAHALAPMPVAGALGAGRVYFECCAPLVLGRGGNAITVSNALHEAMRSAPDADVSTASGAGRALARVVRERPTPLTLAMVFPFSSHNYELRYWLAAAGIDPDQDVRLISVPPPLMVESLREGKVDGFCVGEPWGSMAASEGLGVIVATKSQMFPRAAEKVLAVRPELERRADVLGALLRALTTAAEWCDDPQNRHALASLLARSEYLDMAASLIEGSLAGRLPGRGEEHDFVYFHRDGAGRPSTVEALFAYAQMVRWAQMRPSTAAEARAAVVFRPDLYDRHVIDVEPRRRAVIDAFDGTRFDGRDVSAYLERFAIRAPFLEPKLEAPRE